MVVTPLTNESLLAVWEQSSKQHLIDKALSILSVVLGRSRLELAEMPIGEKNRLLLEYYQCQFNLKLSGMASCPSCKEVVEFDVAVLQLLVTQENIQQQQLHIDGLPSFRLPNSLDMAAIQQCQDYQQVETTLLSRCFGLTEDNKIPALTNEQKQAIENLMREKDPLAEMLLQLTCPQCEHQWHSLLDITRFICDALTGRVKKLLWQVHTLAKAYKWSEADILQMSSLRRNYYLQSVTRE